MIKKIGQKKIEMSFFTVVYKYKVKREGLSL